MTANKEKGMDLIVTLGGSVTLTTNIDEFKEDAKKWLSSINTDLSTDEDFKRADQDVNQCQLIETRIANAKAKALGKIGNVMDIFAEVDKISEEIRQTRLSLHNKSTKRKKERKAEIVRAATTMVRNRITASTVSHLVNVDTVAIENSVHGKRSITTMIEAAEAQAMHQISWIDQVQGNYDRNMQDIHACENDYPGLFPDASVVAGKTPDEVAALIQMRISNFKLATIEKAEKKPPTPSTTPSTTPHPATFSPDHPDSYYVLIDIGTDRDEAIALAKEIDNVFSGRVRKISLKKGEANG